MGVVEVEQMGGACRGGGAGGWGMWRRWSRWVGDVEVGHVEEVEQVVVIIGVSVFLCSNGNGPEEDHLG